MQPTEAAAKTTCIKGSSQEIPTHPSTVQSRQVAHLQSPAASPALPQSVREGCHDQNLDQRESGQTLSNPRSVHHNLPKRGSTQHYLELPLSRERSPHTA